MNSDMTRYAKKLAVADIIRKPFHLLHRAASLDGHDMMHVNTWRDASFLCAQLAQALRTSPHLHLNPAFAPPAAVVQ